MSDKKRGIKLKNLEYRDEGMQELINPVPLDLLVPEDESQDQAIIEQIETEENQAVKDVIGMLEDTKTLLDSA